MRTILALVIYILIAPSVYGQYNCKKVQQIADKTVNNRSVFGISLSISNSDTMCTLSSGNLSDSSLYFIASTTKLYVAAIIFRMDEKGTIHLDDPIWKYLPADVINRLHVLKGVDYSREITVRHLLTHTSGLPDYFQQKDGQGNTLFSHLKNGRDTSWSFENAVAVAKTMHPKFRPGEKRKAYYSDLNFQLLGKIIETSFRLPLREVLKSEIFTPLHLKHTYLYTDASDNRPADLYFGSEQISIPRAMASFQADGGIVSNSAESMVFIKAFFNGRLFSHAYIDSAQDWKKIFPPLQYGTGIMKFSLPAMYTGFRKLPYLIGHSGHSGAFQWYCPERNAYFVGTVNQVNKPSISYKLLVKLMMAI